MARYDEYDDDRVVVIERGNGTNGMGTFLLGLAIGAGAALLFAPASGAETRKRLQDEARRAGRKMKDMTDELGEKVLEGDAVQRIAGGGTGHGPDAGEHGRATQGRAPVFASTAEGVAVD